MYSIYFTEVSFFIILYPRSLVHIFQLGTGLWKYRLGGNRALAFAGIYEQPFALPHFCGISDLQSVCCCSGPNCVSACFVSGVQWRSHVLSLVNGPISTGTEFLKSYLDGTKAKMRLGNYFEKQLYFVGTNELPNRLIFVTQRTSYSHESESMEGNCHVKY